MNDRIESYLASFVSEKRLARMDEVLNLRTRQVCLVLENVLQAHNASAVLRSADAFGIQDVHLITNENKFKASKGITRGCHKWLSLTRHNAREVNNTAACFNQLRAQGYQIACLHPHAQAKSFAELNLGQQKIALVVGSEKEGLSDFALENTDHLIKFPMYGYSESLNLSVLSALCMNEVRKIFNELSPELWQLSTSEKQAVRLEWIRKTVREARQLEARFLSAPL